MKSRLLVLSVVTPLVLALAAFTGACGDDGKEELTLQEYFDKVDAVQSEADPRFESLERRYPDAFDDVGATEDALDAAIGIGTDVHDQLEGIDAPADAADAHQELIAALQALLDLQDAAKALLADVTTPQQLQQLSDDFQKDPTYNAADKRFDDACIALQDIADQNNIEVDLNCGED